MQVLLASHHMDGCPLGPWMFQVLMVMSSFLAGTVGHQVRASSAPGYSQFGAIFPYSNLEGF